MLRISFALLKEQRPGVDKVWPKKFPGEALEFCIYRQSQVRAKT